MKATPLAGIALALIAAFCAFLPMPASAQTGGAVYIVGGVQVDESAPDASAAQRAGFAAAQRVGFDRLVRRVTLPAQQQSINFVAPVGPALERLVLSQDVEEERRSGSRYVGRYTVRFDAAQVRTLLRGAGFTVLDSRTSPVMIVPVVAPDASPETAAAWRAAWSEGGFAQELAPIVLAPEGVGGPMTAAPTWDAAAPFAQSLAAASALYASVRVQGQTATATFVEFGPNGARRDRGEATARIAASGPQGLRAAFLQLAQQASDRIQNEWKARLAAGAGQRSRVSASAIYTDLAQWDRIKDGLEAAAATTISEIRIEAVGRQGALVSFSYVGDQAALAAELRRRGVNLENTQMGPVLRVAGR
jgi:hypothetical protein